MEQESSGCSFLEKYSLKVQYIFSGMVIFGSFLLLVTLLCLGVLLFSNLTVSVAYDKALREQNENNVGSLLEWSSVLFQESLRGGSEGFVSILRYALSDMYSRVGYSLGSTESFFEYGDTFLAQPLQVDPLNRQGGIAVSLTHSSYYVPDSTPDSIRTFSASLNETREKTAHFDNFVRSLYRDHEEIILSYVGFEESGLYRSYPGLGTLESDPQRTFDPRLEEWYIASHSSTASSREGSSSVLYSTPERDENSFLWMMRIHQEIHVESGDVIGVVGANMAISNIMEIVQSLKFLESGKVTLFETSGVVVADEMYSERSASSSQLTYKDLENPQIPEALWLEMISRDENKFSLTWEIAGTEYMVTVQRIQGYGDKFLLAGFLPTSEITQPLQLINSQIRVTSIIVSLALLLFFALGAAVLLWCVVANSRRITRPLENIGHNIHQMVDNIGKPDITEGLQVVGDYSSAADELRELVASYNSMLKHLIKAKKESAEEMLEKNPFYGGEHPFVKKVYVGRPPSMLGEGEVVVEEELTEDDTEDMGEEEETEGESESEEESEGEEESETGEDEDAGEEDDESEIEEDNDDDDD